MRRADKNQRHEMITMRRADKNQRHEMITVRMNLNIFANQSFNCRGYILARTMKNTMYLHKSSDHWFLFVIYHKF